MNQGRRYYQRHLPTPSHHGSVDSVWLSEALKRINENISNIFSICGKLLILVLLIIFLVGIYNQWSSDAYFIDKVEVPGEIAEAGYHEEFITHRLLLAIKDIGTKARSQSDYSQYIRTEQSPEIKADVVGMGLSLDQLSEYVLYFFGKEQNYIRCRLVKSNTDLHIYLQIKGQSIVEIKQDGKNLDQAIDESMHKAAVQILKTTHPITLAYYFFRDGQFKNATKAASLTLENHRHDAKWAYNLIGTMLNDQELYDSAIYPLQEALKIDNTFLSAMNNLGIAYLKSPKRHPDSLAIGYFSKCIRTDTANTYKYASYMLGLAWAKTGSYDSAVHYYKRSISIDSSYVLAYNNLGFTYCYKGKSEPVFYDSALHYLNYALKLPASNNERGILWTTIGETMFYKGDTTAFFDCIEKAAALNYRLPVAAFEAEPYIHFKNDVRFQKLINKKTSL